MPEYLCSPQESTAGPKILTEHSEKQVGFFKKPRLGDPLYIKNEIS